MEVEYVMSNPENQSSPPLPDQAERDKVQTLLDQNLMVQAGAGAGKTFSLIGRLVEGVKSGEIKVDRTAAITFTRKAAGEMRGRFFTGIRKALKEVTDPTEKANLELAAGLIDRCFIGTIHSFCGRLLRERPVEAGLSPDFSELEPRDEAELQREAWDRFVTERLADNDPRFTELPDLGLSPQDLYHSFGRRCTFSELPLKETDVPEPDLSDAVEAAAQFARSIPPLLSVKGQKNPDDLLKKILKANRFLRLHTSFSPSQSAEFLKMLSPAVKDGVVGPALDRFADKEVARNIKTEVWPRLIEEKTGPALRSWRQYLYSKIVPIVDEAVKYYDSLRDQRGLLTFQDLLLKTAFLLRENPIVRQQLQERHRSILVDEFQDTDPIQAQVLLYLTSTDTSEKDWKKCDPKDGSLFVVGDAKQSIYRFRRADLETYKWVKSRIDATNGESVELSTSFRSLGNLCRWYNRAFPDLFEATPEKYQTHFSPLLPHRADGADDYCVRTINLPGNNGNKREEICAMEADRIAAFISSAIAQSEEFRSTRESHLFEKKPQPKDFLILTRTRKYVSVYAAALEKLGIPCDTTGSRLHTRKEIQAIILWLLAAYNPDDHVALLAALRGPLVGMSDPDLYAFHQADGRFHFLSSVPENLQPEIRTRFVEAFNALAWTRETIGRKSPGIGLEMILDRVGWLSLSALGTDGSTRAGSLLRLVALVRRWTEAGNDWPSIFEEFNAMLDGELEDAEGASLEAGSDTAVRIMNLHQAKGLEATVVILADCGDSRKPNDHIDSHVVRHSGEPHISMVVKRPNGPNRLEVVAEPVGWESDLAEEELFTQAEETRLLYVAATRAKNLLVVCTYPKSSKGPWSPLDQALSDVPELSEYTSVPTEHDFREKASLDEWQSDRDRALSEIRKGKWRLSNVTARNEGESPGVAGLGFGKEFGSAVHKALEDWVSKQLPEDPDVYVSSLIKEFQVSPELKDKFLSAIDTFSRSEIAAEVRASKEAYPEVEFTVPENESTLLRGTIDLVYRVEGGWKIVDYKTEYPTGNEEIEAVHSHYRHQLLSYKKFWEHMTSEEVVQTAIWTPTAVIPVA